MRAMRRRLLAILMLGVLVMAGCESEEDTAQVAGTWQLTQTFSTGRVVTLNLTIAQNNGVLAGSSTYGDVNGTVSGSAVNFTIRDEDLKTFVGTVSGETMGGTFTENFENELFRDGDWTAVRVGP